MPEVLLAGPELSTWTLSAPETEARSPTQSGFPLYAIAAEHNSPVYQQTNRHYGRGVLRYGASARVRAHRGRADCQTGRWYELMLGGYVCTSRGFDVLQHEPEWPEDATPADVGDWLPYRYRKAQDGALRFSQPPSSEDLETIAASHDPIALDVVVDRMAGVYFLALTNHVQSRDGEEYVRTVQGHYVPTDVLKSPKFPQMHGERISPSRPLPLAFIYGDEPAPLHWLARGELHDGGEAQKHARMSVRDRRTVDGQSYWVASDGLAVNADRVRVATLRPPPDHIEGQERWIHVDLATQTLVAYRGARPVYATLISSGKEGYETPPGEYQVLHKYVSTTMKGDDPIDGYYNIEEVPWTQYYSGSFALHGAFWHDDFGRVRSHGCTNLAPPDARWLYYFTKPRVPPGWHGLRKLGTRIVITS